MWWLTGGKFSTINESDARTAHHHHTAGTGARRLERRDHRHYLHSIPNNHQHWTLDFTDTLHGLGHHTGNTAIITLRNRVHLSFASFFSGKRKYVLRRSQSRSWWWVRNNSFCYHRPFCRLLKLTCKHEISLTCLRFCLSVYSACIYCRFNNCKICL